MGVLFYKLGYQDYILIDSAKSISIGLSHTHWMNALWSYQTRRLK